MALEVDRARLGRIGKNGELSAKAIDAALTICGLRPAPAEWRGFALRTLRFAGVLSLAAGIIFLVAFNWQALGIYGRFAMIQAPLLAALVFAFAKGANQLPGKLALLFAVLMTGAVLALFGQTYQTGADAYELFLAWTALGLPWVVASRYTPCWALWLLLLNLTAALYAAGVEHTSDDGLSAWLLPALLDLSTYLALEALASRPTSALSPRWLRRAVMAAAMAFGTAVMVVRIAVFRVSDGLAVSVEILLFLAASATLAGIAYARKNDLFALAVLALAWVTVTTTLIGRGMIEAHAGVGALFLIALYLIAASTGAVKAISYIGQQWKAEGEGG